MGQRLLKQNDLKLNLLRRKPVERTLITVQALSVILRVISYQIKTDKKFPNNAQYFPFRPLFSHLF